MIITGIADEAGTDIETQIKAHKELDWNHIELRLVDGKNIAGESTDKDFDRIYGVLDSQEISVTGFASRIGNWSRHINDDFSLDIQDLKASIPRMKKLGVKPIRVMSWKGDGVEEVKWRNEAIRRMKELSMIAEDGEVLLCHENCYGWGGLSVQNMLELRNEVNSSSFALLYDIGNTLSHGLEPEPFFKGIRNNFSYLHIKDVRRKEGEKGSDDYVFCGEGDAHVREYLEKIILEDRYDGVISIEPHVAAVVHKTGGTASPELMFDSYLKYGKLLTVMVKDILSRG